MKSSLGLPSVPGMRPLEQGELVGKDDVIYRIYEDHAENILVKGDGCYFGYNPAVWTNHHPYRPTSLPFKRKVNAEPLPLP